MNTNFNNQIANQYTSNSQKIRVLTEDWVDREIFCPACGNNIDNYENNRPVADFFCPTCKEEYELKSKKNSIGSKIVDGAYKTMIERLQSNNNPNFFLLNYNIKNYSIQNFFVIPKHFFVPEIIEKRKPLSDTARRAGWIGCNILLKTIPQTGKIFYIKNQKAESKSKVLNDWQKTLFLREQKEPLSKGWVLDVMNCIDRLEKNEIRQQLQLLRDKGYLSFVSRGKYKLN